MVLLGAAYVGRVYFIFIALAAMYCRKVGDCCSDLGLLMAFCVMESWVGMVVWCVAVGCVCVRFVLSGCATGGLVSFGAGFVGDSDMLGMRTTSNMSDGAGVGCLWCLWCFLWMFKM